MLGWAQGNDGGGNTYRIFVGKSLAKYPIGKTEDDIGE
jgi:hypothetical protein